MTLDYLDLPLSSDLGSRDRDSAERVTVDYNEPPTRPAIERPRSAPELIDMGVRPMGRETLAAITGDLAQELLRSLSLEERAAWLQQMEGAITLEPFHFEIRGVPMLERPNDVLRREFVAVRLLHRLPVRSINDVARIDVAPAAEAQSLLLTLWVKVPEAH